jgi:hypothetical protein
MDVPIMRFQNILPGAPGPKAICLGSLIEQSIDPARKQ